MTRIGDLAEKYDLKNWPHAFTKTGKVFEIGHDPLTGDGIFAVEMTCVYCGTTFVNGQTNRPPDPCPARTQKTEMKRLLN